MNYGPYMGMPYYNIANVAPRSGLFSKLLGGINFSNILNTTQKTLNVVNQAIPVIKQVQPVIRNAKTMFKVMNEFKRNETPTNNSSSKKTDVNADNKIEIEENNVINSSPSEGLTFFM